MIRGTDRGMAEPLTAARAVRIAEPGHRARLVWFALAVIVLMGGAVVAALTVDRAVEAGRVGADLKLYLQAAGGFLDGGGLYPAQQLAGPYVVADGDILYPPPILLLMVPFLILPAILFWVVPIGIIAVIVARHRPEPWSWPLLALALSYPITSLKIVHGNPVMWVAAAIALATITVGPAVVVLVKPTLAPFALIGANRRRWWLALAVFGFVAALFAPLWPDYVKVVTNAHNPNGLLYSLDEVPLVLIPIVAWIASPRFAIPARLPSLIRR